MTPAQLDARMKVNGVGPKVRARVLRLNPQGVDEGTRPRGFHPKYSVSRINSFFDDTIGKGAFIKEFGRAAWARIPAEYIRKDGRRQAITRNAYLDRVWMAS